MSNGFREDLKKRLEEELREEVVGLVLGGGGSRGAYEAGVWKALRELGIHPKVVTGASVGSINGAMVAQKDYENTIRIWGETETHMIFDVEEGSGTFDYAKEVILNQGAGTSGLMALLEKYLDEDKIRSSDICFAFTVFCLSEMKGHFLRMEDIPHGRLNDYILAGASAFPALHSHEIDGKSYIDGGYADILPIDLAVECGATKIIAVNIHGPGRVHKDSIRRAPKLTLIEPTCDLGNFLVFDTDNAKRILEIGYLDALKAFGAADGDRYAFEVGAFTPVGLKQAEAFANVFEMDPTVLYGREDFLSRAKEVAAKVYDAAKDTIEAYRENPLWRLSIKELANIASDAQNVVTFESLAFLVAGDIREHNEDSIFVSRAAVKLMPDVVKAARFIILNHIAE